MTWFTCITERYYRRGVHRSSREDPKRLVRYDDMSELDAKAKNFWDHVVEKSGGDETATLETYKESVKRVEDKARAIYDDRFHLPDSDEFVETMIKRGCVTLQVVLGSMGNREVLDYLPKDTLYNQENLEESVMLMFDLRLQIPLVVLNELLKQSFFQTILKSRKWKRPTELPWMVLYDFLVKPMIGGHVNFTGPSHQEPPTLLHGLWLLLIGPVSDDAEDVDEDGEKAWSTVPSAVELQKTGITFRSNEGTGLRGIRFKKQMLNASLYLPSIPFHDYTWILFENLINYESEEGFNRNRREVCAYLKIMRELVRTPHDANFLAMQGIIHADLEQEIQLPSMFGYLTIPEVKSSHNLVLVGHQIRSYLKPKPWEKVEILFYFTIFLTLVQTIYTALSFHYKK